MSPEHVSTGDTALLAAVTPLPGHERLLSVVLVSPERAISAHRVSSPIVVGREDACELALPDQATSRRHARLVPRATGIEVTDLESRNGTFVDGHPAQRTIAQPGSVIRIGSYLLLVVQLDEVWQAPAVEGPLVGGAAVAPVRRSIGLVGPTELPVLILGETGTGKEVVARLLHAASGRTGPFVAVNCASLPENLVESELFGHVRGAFTGAERNRQGLLALAHTGTLFLDELGELPLQAQAKLLRVLEDRMVRSVGAERSSRVDVRFISATNVNLESATTDGRFRADLFARLAAVEIRLPALRHRREDLPALAQFLLERAGLPPLALTPDAMEALLLHAWPHNIRELENLLRAAALRGTALDLGDLPMHLQAQLREARRESPQSAIATPLDDPRGRMITALQAHHGNVRQVAIALGIGRGHVYRLLKRFDLEPASFRPRGPIAARPHREGP
ncbi:MAG TPA: sigma 54-interacting transcriptional regulator [Kofleriaceae bacterium]